MIGHAWILDHSHFHVQEVSITWDGRVVDQLRAADRGVFELDCEDDLMI